jgi:hypothetical protein
MNAPVQAGRVELKIFSPHQPVRFISARSSGQIQALQTLWPNAPKMFIFSGLELAQEMTFDDYGMRDGDALVALPIGDKEKTSRSSMWMALTREYENFNECVRWILSPTTSAESARLRDLHRMTVEDRQWMPRATKSRHSDREPYSPASNLTMISYDAPLSPMTSPLPVLWDTSEPQL